MNKVIVTIDGVEYPMVGDKSEQHMISVAKFVDDEMKTIKESNSKLSTAKIAILTALNIMDKLVEGSNENDQLSKENEELKKKVGSSDGELKLEIKKFQLDLHAKSKEKETLLTQIEELNKKIESQNTEISKLKEKVESFKDETEKFKSQIEELKSEAESANERAKAAEETASEFQNRAYKVQLEKTELEMRLR